MTLAPVLLFTYNRPAHTKQTLDALLKNPLSKESTLFVFRMDTKMKWTDNK